MRFLTYAKFLARFSKSEFQLSVRFVEAFQFRFHFMNLFLIRSNFSFARFNLLFKFLDFVIQNKLELFQFLKIVHYRVLQIRIQIFCSPTLSSRGSKNNQKGIELDCTLIFLFQVVGSFFFFLNGLIPFHNFMFKTNNIFFQTSYNRLKFSIFKFSTFCFLLTLFNFSLQVAEFLSQKTSLTLNMKTLHES